ncbi:MAG: sensor domain-containing phosphodiesterase [Cyanobium usitatum Tobar12.5m-G36]|nr:sensor domain-containing phosphodiesterase [Cyanobium usitatum Tobar12.5m-G36]
MQEASIPEDDSARLKELQSCGVLNTQSEAIFDDITHLVQDITGAKIGVISLIDENRQWFKSCVGLEDAPKETPRNISFCGHTIVQRRPLIINDALEDDRFADNPLVLGEPRIRFYAGFPLIAANGFALGSLCAIDIEPKALTPKQVTSLERLARQVVSQMELRREAHLLQSAELALQAQGGNGQVKPGIQLLSEINPVMNREQLQQMLSLLLGLDQPPCFALARCKFKEYSRVSATIGSAAAENLIQTGLERLRDCLPAQASTAYFSDDEIAIVLPHLSEESALTAIAERCMARLEAPLKLNDRDIELGINMGIAIFRKNYSDVDSLLSDASIAQRIAITDRSKNSNFNFIDLPARLAAQQHYQVETDLRRAIRRNEITPYLQPIVDLATGKPVGLECLMRWRTDSGEMMLPNNFLPISHLAGLSGELDLQIIQKAIQASHEIASAAPGKPLQLSVNLSALLLESEGQRQRLLQLIRSTPLPKDWQLQVELVEDYLHDNGSELGIFLNSLRRLGVTIAIDDFGTGYSSLSRLHNYPVRTVKVDCSFVERIDDSSNPSNQLLKTIQNLCADLGLDSTAEGVETDSQSAWLVQNGYKHGQGNLFSRPMSVAATAHYLAEFH